MDPITYAHERFDLETSLETYVMGVYDDTRIEVDVAVKVADGHHCIRLYDIRDDAGVIVPGTVVPQSFDTLDELEAYVGRFLPEGY